MIFFLLDYWATQEILYTFYLLTVIVVVGIFYFYMMRLVCHFIVIVFMLASHNKRKSNIWKMIPSRRFNWGFIFYLAPPYSKAYIYVMGLVKRRYSRRGRKNYFVQRGVLKVYVEGVAWRYSVKKGVLKGALPRFQFIFRLSISQK